MIKLNKKHYFEVVLRQISCCQLTQDRQKLEIWGKAQRESARRSNPIGRKFKEGRMKFPQ